MITVTFLLSDLMISSSFSFFLTCHWSASWYCWSLPPLRHSPWLPGPTFSWFKLLIHSWCCFFLMFQPPNTGVAQDSALKCSFLDIYWVSGGAIQSWVLNIISILTAPVLPSYLISKGSSKLPIQYLHCRSRASLVDQLVKNLPVMWKTWVWSLDWEDPLEKGMATHSSILVWRIPRTM